MPQPTVAVAPPAAPASPVAAARPAARPAPQPAEEPGFVASLLDNPLTLPLGGALVALLAGLGFYRLRTRAGKDSGETSFLESRLQPDSFFGASGGQRIDTRDASGVSSSMSYSLSQLDAIGDVDPVAEADVYLAYGRDLQAEEILKEAMRGDPERLAIRTKLLEVYAKRRDTKGFELLATQLFGLTHGDGEDWHKAQELGVSIDPENPLYQPGGRPAAAPPGSGRSTDAIDQSTMPQSALAVPSRFLPSQPPEATEPSEQGVDLDLDLDVVDSAEPAHLSPMESTQPLSAAVRAAELQEEGLEFDLPTLDERKARRACAARGDGHGLQLRPERPVARSRRAERARGRAGRGLRRPGPASGRSRRRRRPPRAQARAGRGVPADRGHRRRARPARGSDRRGQRPAEEPRPEHAQQPRLMRPEAAGPPR